MDTSSYRLFKNITVNALNISLRLILRFIVVLVFYMVKNSLGKLRPQNGSGAIFFLDENVIKLLRKKLIVRTAVS